MDHIQALTSTTFKSIESLAKAHVSRETLIYAGACGAAALLAYYAVFQAPRPSFVVHRNGVVFVTGASTGIGQSAAIAIAGAGYTVVAGVFAEEDKGILLAECEKKRGSQARGRLIPVLLDVTKQDSIDSAFQVVSSWISTNKQPLVGIVNNAGLCNGGPVEVMPLSSFRTLMEVNYFGMIAVTQKFLPLVREHRGRVVNVSSIAGIMAGAFGSAYAASKFAVEGLSESLRKEMRPLGVSVSTINPGCIKTPLFTKLMTSLVRKEDMTADQQAIYAKFFRAFEDTRFYDMAATTDVTDEAMLHALTARTPKVHYFVSNVMGVSAWVVNRMHQFLPSNLFDALEVSM